MSSFLSGRGRKRILLPHSSCPAFPPFLYQYSLYRSMFAARGAGLEEIREILIIL
jgi:hypothetical protein